MKQNKNIYDYFYCKNSDKLKELIAEYPDYPLVFLAAEDANIGEYSTMFCSIVSFEVGEMLDVEAPCNDEIVYTDREDFEDAMSDWLFDRLIVEGRDNIPDKEFDDMLQQEIKKYDEHWMKVIMITVGN